MTFKDYRDIIRQMEREMQQLSDEAFRGFFAIPAGGAGRFWQPPVDIHETNDALVVKVELSGAKADDLQVSLAADDRILLITGARIEGHADRDGRIRCHQLEVYFGPFERAIPLPSSVPVDRDKIKASYREGFLVITLPKRPVSAELPKTRVIPVTDTDQDEPNNPSESEGDTFHV